jgi:H+/Cl- antiporter ClcA
MAPVALVSGSASALFLWALDEATRLRLQYPALLFGLAPMGVLIVWLYRTWGGRAERGNNLLLDEIHEPGGGVPARMAPLVLITSVLTHLVGGSAGREGTAVQMGGSLAGVWARWFRLPDSDRRILLMGGMAAGFGSIFGTPLAGAIFALEVLAVGRMTYGALVPCLIASILGDMACSAWGAHHTEYEVLFSSADLPVFSVERGVLLGEALGAGALFGLVARLFAGSVHGLQALYVRYVPVVYLRPVIGSAVLLALVWGLGTPDYLGLGVLPQRPGGVSILSAFEPGGAMPFSWGWKLIFTAVTLSSGFKGGEVTPLFFIGACLGNVLATLVGAPVDLFAALGFIAVFGAAANTPLACTLMGLELFGSGNLVFFAVACFTAYLFSGSRGIYSAQRMGVPKSSDSTPGQSLRPRP